MIQRRATSLDGLPLVTALALCAGLLLWISRGGSARSSQVLAAEARLATDSTRWALHGEQAPQTPFGTRTIDELLELVFDPPVLRREAPSPERSTLTVARADPSHEASSDPRWILLHDDSGRVVVEGRTVDGVPDGPWHFRAGGGARQAEGQFQRGVPHGSWMAWHEDGTPRAELAYDSGLPSGLRQEWWPNGVKALEGGYVDGLRDGPWLTWHENGALRAQGTYVAGLRDGSWNEWFSGGGPRLQAEYVAGSPEGLFRTWHENGAVAEEGHFVAGLREGTWGFFTPDGKRERRSGLYAAGVRQKP